MSNIHRPKTGSDTQGALRSRLKAHEFFHNRLPSVLQRALDARNLPFNLQENSGYLRFTDFMERTAEKFQLDFSKIFPQDQPEEVFLFADQLGDFLAKSRQRSQAHDAMRQRHRIPSELYPSDEKWEFQQDFFSFFVFFIHYGQRRDVENRPYYEHLLDVEGDVDRYYEGMSATTKLAAKAHDSREDFMHQEGLLVRGGLRKEQEDAFGAYMLEEMDLVAERIYYPDFLKTINPRVFFPDLYGADEKFATGDDFDELVQKTYKLSTFVLLLSKLKGKIPGNPKDRYNDAVAKCDRILEHRDVRFQMIAMANYFPTKGGDTTVNYKSFDNKPEHASVTPGLMSHEQGKKAEEKKRQMRGLAANFFLPGMRAFRALVAHYNVRDILRAPDFDGRQQYAKLKSDFLKKANDSSMITRFETNLLSHVQKEFVMESGEDLDPDALEIEMWDRDIWPRRQIVGKAIRSGRMPSTQEFLHIVDIRILDPDRRHALLLRNILNDYLEKLCPTELYVDGAVNPATGLTSPRVLKPSLSLSDEEVEHPLIRGFCKIRTDASVRKKNNEKIGVMVYRVHTLQEMRRDFEGVFPMVYLEQNLMAFKQLGSTLLDLKGSVTHLSGHLRRLEDEIQRISSLATPEGVMHMIGDMVHEVSDLLRHFSPTGNSEVEPLPPVWCGVFGYDVDRDNPESLRGYLADLNRAYYVWKEQALTLMLPRKVIREVRYYDSDNQLLDLKVGPFMIPEMPPLGHGEKLSPFAKDYPLYAFYYLNPDRVFESAHAEFKDEHEDVLEVKVNYLLERDGRTETTTRDEVKRFARRNLYPDKV